MFINPLIIREEQLKFINLPQFLGVQKLFADEKIKLEELTESRVQLEKATKLASHLKAQIEAQTLSTASTAPVVALENRTDIELETSLRKLKVMLH